MPRSSENKKVRKKKRGRTYQCERKAGDGVPHGLSSCIFSHWRHICMHLGVVNIRITREKEDIPVRNRDLMPPVAHSPVITRAFLCSCARFNKEKVRTCVASQANVVSRFLAFFSCCCHV